jgi:glutaminyl-tRNA synthetase
VQATLHWVCAAAARPAEVRLYNHLFIHAAPDSASLGTQLNPNSLEVLAHARVEPALADEEPGTAVQFERQGYFCRDPGSDADPLVFNRTVGLRDTWAKLQSAAAT